MGYSVLINKVANTGAPDFSSGVKVASRKMNISKNGKAGAEYIQLTIGQKLAAALHPLIEHFTAIADEVWLLFDSSWPHTKAATSIGQRLCTDIVSVGRLKWFLNSKHDATDDCSWYRFSTDKSAPTRFHWPSCTRDQSARLL
jgi:hypothetical protein